MSGPRALSPLLAPLVLALLAPPARAERVVLADGQELVGALLLEEEAELVLLCDGGVRCLPRGEVVALDRETPAPTRLQSRAERARVQVLEERARGLRLLLRRYPRLDTAERLAVEAQVRAAPREARRVALSRVLDEGPSLVRPLAVAGLAELGAEAALRPLVKASLLCPDAEVREAAHAALLGLDRQAARDGYLATVTSPNAPRTRMRALGRLEAMGDLDAVPGLIRALEVVGFELRAQLATAKDLRRVPVDLGSTGAAGTKVPVELPELSLVEVGTSAQTTVASLRALQGATTRVLGSLSGQALGEDPAAWRRWWDDRGR